MARQFNGSSDHIDADSAVPNLSGQQAFSLAGWINASIAQSSALNPMSIAAAAAGPFFQLQGDASGKLLIAARSATSGGSDTTASTAVAFNSAWHHFCVTQPSGSSTLSIYLDGALDHTFARTSLSNGTTQTFTTLCFGALHRSGAFSQFYGGGLGDLAIWARTLTAQEVALLGSGAEASLLGPNHYWPLWGVDSPEPDIGNG